ncbi:uncharacterized protein AMSG_02983 [Thecamonas trahens ATCC 50062]|uniref:Uncharacterized protein n=1 Tax=Thecamonas trahens ATCC 50062 TaxID=461836 RepID=A0A0L0D5F1_THETB|nr:hypothetical protein AMSG_02983 [Thecamonas trahens ATCC 50062]KNC46548.1 hypothetical protein AMSG_02983 [Thecamonas trahens ATCC 50062]|eukprot:XP_013760327.1 hypothetical protein AMSG_02983 [Thecamonas trahens ATCC 50062]
MSDQNIKRKASVLSKPTRVSPVTDPLAGSASTAGAGNGVGGSTSQGSGEALTNSLSTESLGSTDGRTGAARGSQGAGRGPGRTPQAAGASGRVFAADGRAADEPADDEVGELSEGERKGESSRFVRVGEPSEAYAGNAIHTSKYTWYSFLPRNLYEQFRRVANVFFLAVAILQQIPGVSPTGRYTTILPLGLVLFVTGLKAAIEDWRRHRSDKMTNATPGRVLRWKASSGAESRRRSGRAGDDDGYHGADSSHPGLNNVESPEWESVAWSDIVVGDVVRVEADETFPADMVLLASSRVDGTASVETANLDGETNLKQRRSLEQTAHLQDAEELAQFCVAGVSIEYELASPVVHRFSGNVHMPRLGRGPTGERQWQSQASDVVPAL